jgi:ABC-type bacteriocin/lantibiotic exporter with double-glycine peptidase domain
VSNKAPRALFVVVVAFTAACRLPYSGGAKPVEVTTIDDSWHRAAPTPVVRQQDRTDCGLAALAMVAGAWGHSWSVPELRQALPTTKEGVRLGALRDYARSRGLVAYAVKGTHSDLVFELSRHRPVLLGLVLPFARDKALAHYEVAIAVDPRDGAVITQDPATGKMMRRTREVLDLEWKPSHYATLVVVGTTQASVARAGR